MQKGETIELEGIGRVRLRLRPTEEELIQAERAKRARGFFLALVETLLIEPPYVREDWVRLPEEELRKLALLIAEANGLLPSFRPKKEKQFYNAFRNAWRMKRSSHNEAVFQRALAILRKACGRAGFLNGVTVAVVLLLMPWLAVVAQSAESPVSRWFPDAVYELNKELTIGGYVVRVWHNIASDGRPYHGIVTIAAKGQVLVRHEWALGVEDLSGTDITGEGNPDIIIQTYSGGAHCCFDTFLYDLGTALTEIPVPASPGGNHCGHFEDLDGDGIYEFLSVDDSFAYRYCAYAGTPIVRVVLKYEPRAGYVPASPEFAYLYTEDISVHTQWAERARQGLVHTGWDNTSKCSVLPLVLDYLYSGYPDMAWDALYKYYAFPDVEEFRADIEQVVYGSPYFTFPTKSNATKETELPLVRIRVQGL